MAGCRYGPVAPSAGGTAGRDRYGGRGQPLAGTTGRRAADRSAVPAAGHPVRARSPRCRPGRSPRRRGAVRGRRRGELRRQPRRARRGRRDLWRAPDHLRTGGCAGAARRPGAARAAARTAYGRAPGLRRRGMPALGAATRPAVPRSAVVAAPRTRPPTAADRAARGRPGAQQCPGGAPTQGNPVDDRHHRPLRRASGSACRGGDRPRADGRRSGRCSSGAPSLARSAFVRVSGRQGERAAGDVERIAGAQAPGRRMPGDQVSTSSAGSSMPSTACSSAADAHAQDPRTVTRSAPCLAHQRLVVR